MTVSATTEEIDAVAAFSRSTEALLRSRSPLARVRSLRHSVPRFDRSLWEVLAEAGWTAILAPEDAGGLDLGLRHACAVAEQVGRHPLPEPFVAGAVQAVSLLASLPGGERRDRLLASAVRGERLLGVAWQERAGQLEPDEALDTHAVPDGVGDDVRLEGVKRWVVPGTGADGWLVSAASASGPGIWWVPASSAGLAVEEDARIDGSTSATLALAGVVVPASHRLATGSAALEALRKANDSARVVQAAELLGIARRAFEATREYLQTRIQFDRPIGANQVLQHRMVDAYIQIELASACLEEALREAQADPGRLDAAASRAKARCAHAALHVTRLGVQLHGAIGYTDECDIGLYLKRALQLAGWLGSEQAMRLRHHRHACASGDSGTQPGVDPAPPAAVRDADWTAMDESDFRRMVRGFLGAHYPDRLRHPAHRLRWEECRAWYMTLARQGWLAPAWPRAHGGMALPGSKLLAFIEEMEDYGVARLPDQGIINLGPLLIRFGTPEQQREYLPKILSGEHLWCQGYSEPGAGSDLASLRTVAVPDGDEFVVNGQKIWTTLAQDATHIFLLVRTDRSAKKQAGISFLLVDMSSPGVSVRPIRNIAGEEEFCEVFFDDVRVPRRNLVGQMNGGWTIAKSLLGFERLFVGSPKTAQYALGLLRRAGEGRGLFAQGWFVARWSQLELDVADLKAAYGRFAEIVKRGDELPASVSILKIWASETYTAITRFMFEVCEEHGGALGDVDLGAGSVNVAAPLLNAMITTIYAGSNEIQRNILARAVLDLPG